MNNETARYMMMTHGMQMLLNHTSGICDMLLRTGKFNGADAENLRNVIDLQSCMSRTLASMPVAIDSNDCSGATFSRIELDKEYGMFRIVESESFDFESEPISTPHSMYNGFADKRSALHSLMHDVATEYPFLINYEDSGELLTYFATLFMNYSNHDKRDVELKLEEVEHLRKIRWCLTADHEILDCGTYIVDKDVPF